MSRVNIDGKVFTDPRFKKLARILGCDRFGAIGRMAAIWHHCTENHTYSLSEDEAEDISDTPGMGGAMVGAGLAEDMPDGRFRVRGTEGRIEWLAMRRQAAASGGKKRAGGAPRNADGTLASSSQTPAKHPAKPTSHSPATVQPSIQPNTSQASSQTLDDHQPNTSPLALALALAPALKDPPAKPGPSGKAPKPKGDQRIAPVLDRFDKLHRAATGLPYPDHPAIAKFVSGLSPDYTTEVLVGIVDDFFATTTGWGADKPRSVAVFRTQFPDLVAKRGKANGGAEDFGEQLRKAANDAAWARG